MSTDALFVYGSLMVPRVRSRVVGRVVESVSAELPAHERRILTGTPYPAVRRRHGALVRGELLLGLRGPELARLDAYEGGLYQRARVRVWTPRGERMAFTYVIRPQFEHRLGREDWCLDEFLDRLV